MRLTRSTARSFRLLGHTPPGYEPYDKALDVYYLTIAYLSTVANWPAGMAFSVARFLFYYRLVGVLLFEVTKARWLLFVFANTFEYFFIAIEAYKIARNPFTLPRSRIIAIAAGIWIFIKLPQEWWIHIAQLDLTDVLARYVLNQPIVLIAVAIGAAVVLAIGTVIAWRARRLLPRRAWEPTVSAHAQADHMNWKPAPVKAGPPRSLDSRLVEKIALVTLVAAIFGRILPGASQNNLRMVVDAVVLIVVSTLVSEPLRRLPATWYRPIIRFATIGAANLLAAAAVAVLVPRVGPEPPLVTVVFLIGLLTLIVVLFDAFDATRIRRIRRSAATG